LAEVTANGKITLSSLFLAHFNKEFFFNKNFLGISVALNF